MKKIIVFLFVFWSGPDVVSSQVLFTYGKKAVDVKEFLRVYEKNYSPTETNKEKAVKDYLDLYIKSRLKVQEAYDLGYDTLPNLLAEVNNFRAQIIENYMTDPSMLNRMIQEAFQRSQKDIHVAHIFISFKNASGTTDTVSATIKKNEILTRLKKGEDFSAIASAFSDDPMAKTNKGDIGYITVFSLPYEFENVIYNTSPGNYTEIVRSNNGYHLFKNIRERKAIGKIKAQQILLAFPPEADQAVKTKIALLADSLYKRILAGENFSSLAASFSNDYISAASGGNIPDVGVGQFEPIFENAVWGLAKDDAVTRPFQTSHGWHIVKRLSVKPVVTDKENKTYQQELQQKIMTDGRWKSSSDFIYNIVVKKAGFKKVPYEDAALWAYSDSLLDNKPMNPVGKNIQSSTPLFSIGRITYDATAWINYARTYRFKADGTGVKPFAELREEWIRSTLRNYYRDNLEDLNEEFRIQITEFKEGNMFFEIMQKKIWNKAQDDTASLRELYNKNPKKYLWKQSADVVIFFCSDQSVCSTVYRELKQNPADWKKIAEKYAERVIGDSSRYEWDQIPNLDKGIPKEGMLTEPVTNSADNTASFAYVFKTYPDPVQRSFAEAKGLVINDYQEALEKRWNDQLNKKYPVVINEKVLKSISK